MRDKQKHIQETPIGKPAILNFNLHQSGSVEDRLMLKGKEYRSKRQLMQHDLAISKEKHSFRPSIGS